LGSSPPTDHHHLADERQAQLDHRVAAVGDDDDRSLRQPPPGLQQGLSRPIRELLVALPGFLGGALGGAEHGEERQAPGGAGERHPGDDHERQPAEPGNLDEAALARAHRVPIDPLGGDPRALAALDRVVDPDHHRPFRHERGDDQRQEEPRAFERAPARRVEQAMEAREARVTAFADGAQRRGDGAWPGGQENAGGHRLEPSQRRSGEQATERRQPPPRRRWGDDVHGIRSAGESEPLSVGGTGSQGARR
jgi:hypothetical protein